MSRKKSVGERRGGLSQVPRPAGWRVRLVGMVAVCGADGMWQAPPVGSRKARTLLALLAARHDRGVELGQVVHTLWGDAPPRRPEANVATLVSRLRASFGPEMIVGGRGGYRLGESTRVDLYDAADLAAQARRAVRDGRPATALLAAEQALQLLEGGPVLADYTTMDWAEQARCFQVGLLRRARHAAAEAALQTGAPRRTQTLSEAALAADPLDEAACRLLMRACAATGEPARALIAYERLRGTLAAELRTTPVSATRDLHVAILRANTVSA